MKRALVPVTGWYANTDPADVQGPLDVLAVSLPAQDVDEDDSPTDWVIGIDAHGHLAWVPADSVVFHRSES